MADIAVLSKEEDGAVPDSEFFPIEIRRGRSRFNGRGCKLTPKGISCLFDTEFSADSPVEIKLLLPSPGSGDGRQEVVCLARPASARRGTGGFEIDFNFRRLPAGVRRKIDEYLAWSKRNRRPGEKPMVSHQANLARNGVTCKSDREIPLFQEVEVEMVAGEGGSSTGKDPVRLPAVVVNCAREKRGGRFDLTLYFTELTDRHKRILKARLPRTSSRAGAAKT